MIKLSADDVRMLLGGQNFDGLMGAVEYEHFDAKRSPYPLKDDASRYELAKDVTAFANAMGGVIVIGFRADRPDPSHPYETVAEVTPFPSSLLNPEQYRDVLRSWVYPPTDHLVDVVSYPLPADPERAVAAIYVSASSARETFLITRALSEHGKANERSFAFAERLRARTAFWTVQQVHAMISVGRLAGPDQLERLEGAIARLEGLGPPAAHGPLTTTGQSPDPIVPTGTLDLAGLAPTVKVDPVRLAPRPSIENRVSDAISSASLENLPAFYLAAEPQGTGQVSRFLEAQSSVAQLVASPPEIRRDGFGLNTGGTPQLVNGQVRRALAPEYKLLEIFRDGAVVFVGRGDGDYLAWASPKSQRLINTLTLVEATLLFARTVAAVIAELAPPPTLVNYALGLRRMGQGDAATFLRPYRVSVEPFRGRLSARPSPDESLDVRLSLSAQEPPERVAAALVEEVYGWFGVDLKDVPYLKSEDGRRVVDVELLRSPHG